MTYREIIYKRGSFYGIETGNRIQITDNSELLVKEDKITTHFEKQYQVLTPQELKKKIENDEKVKSHQRVLCANQELFFKIRALDKNLCLLFTIKLSEDLYLYKTDKGKKKFYDCTCQLTDCVNIENNNRVDSFKITFGKSLSEIYHNTSIQYFGNDRSAITLIYTTFFTDRSLSKEYIIDRFRKNYNS